MKLSKIITPLFALGLALGASAVEAAEHPSNLLLLTKLIDQVPSKAQLVSAGAGEDGAALFAIATDKTLSRYPRARAASMLGHFDSAKGRAQLKALLDDAEIVDREVKIQALASLVYLDKSATFDRLSGLLTHPDPQLRAAAVRNLGRIDHPGVQAALQARLVDGAEPVAWVRALTERTANR